MPIENRNLEVGTKLIAHYKKVEHHGLVIAGDDRKVRYTLSPYDGKEYKSPSSLGTAVTGKSCNGWAFWSLDTGETTEPETETPPEETAPEDSNEEPAEEEPEEPITLGFRRVPNQKRVDPGQVRLYCDACHNSFIVPQSKNPTECPMGHRPG
ncbi:MAG: hypothetical protein ACE5Q6_06805 [Dehalococcoidia bacterium]